MYLLVAEKGLAGSLSGRVNGRSWNSIREVGLGRLFWSERYSIEH